MNMNPESQTHSLSAVLHDLAQLPEDAIYHANKLYQADPNPQKVNVSIGTYSDDNGLPYIFPAVRSAEEKLSTAEYLKNDYLPIDGLASLKPMTQELVFSNKSRAFVEKRIVSIQSLSGTGALRLATDFIVQHLANATVYVSQPTWANHVGIFKDAGLQIKYYPYWNKAESRIDISGMLRVLSQAPQFSVVLLQVCGHNPTGADPTEKDWKDILEVVKKQRLLPMFDLAYQGCCSGDLDADAAPIRLFDAAGVDIIVAQSFSKNMGMYGQRIGMLHLTTASPELATTVLLHLKCLARTAYSSPPAWGGYVVNEVLGNPALRQQWIEELRSELVTRLRTIRKDIYDGLIRRKTPGSWGHILEQHGMFSFTGLTPAQCKRLVEKWHIYILETGRLSLAGVNSKNIEYVLDAIDESVRTTTTA